jgi:hypothetical protein
MAHSKISYRVKIDNATMALTCLLWIGVFFVVQLVIFNELYDKTHHIAALLYIFFLLTSLCITIVLAFRFLRQRRTLMQAFCKEV